MGVIIKEVKKIDYLKIALEYCKERAEFSKGNDNSPCYCAFTIEEKALTGEAAFEVYHLAFAQGRCAFWVETCISYKELEMDKIENQAKSVIAYAFLAGTKEAIMLAKWLNCFENKFLQDFFKWLD